MAEHLDLVLERTLDAPVDLVWEAYTDPEHLKQWFAPKPYQISECELDLRPGGIFRIRMVGPDGFDTGHGNAGCVLEVVERQRLTWTSALGPGYRPAEMGEGCESFPMTAIVTFADAGNGELQGRRIAQGHRGPRQSREDGLPGWLGHRGRPACRICEDARRERLAKRNAPESFDPGASSFT